MILQTKEVYKNNYLIHVKIDLYFVILSLLRNQNYLD